GRRWGAPGAGQAQAEAGRGAAAPQGQAEEEEGATVSGGDGFEVEASGETVGEAKWVALRELEKLQPALDKSAVSFQVLSEGQRGLLGVGYSPARVIARADPAAMTASAPEPVRDESALAGRVRELVGRIAREIAGHVNVE